jgi:hypothetical protein
MRLLKRRATDEEDAIAFVTVTTQDDATETTIRLRFAVVDKSRATVRAETTPEQYHQPRPHRMEHGGAVAGETLELEDVQRITYGRHVEPGEHRIPEPVAQYLFEEGAQVVQA